MLHLVFTGKRFLEGGDLVAGHAEEVLGSQRFLHLLEILRTVRRPAGKRTSLANGGSCGAERVGHVGGLH